MTATREHLPNPRLRITQRALDKAALCARLVCEQFGSPVESIGFLVTDQAEKGPDRLITDIVLAWDQAVSPNYVEISPSGVLKTGREVERKGLYVVGWIHVHIGETFHSTTDCDNMRQVLNDLAAANEWPLRGRERATVQWEGEALVIRTGTDSIRLTGESLSAIRPAALPECLAGDDAPGLQAEVVASVALVASAAFSLVVSATGRQPYAEMATRVTCAVCGEVEERTRQVPIEIVDPDPLNEEELRSEIRRKVRNLPACRESVQACEPQRAAPEAAKPAFLVRDCLTEFVLRPDGCAPGETHPSANTHTAREVTS
jgi:proteasome lid subunit RPN8/RPN11